MVACPLAAASLPFCEVVPDRWVRPHFAVRAAFSSGRWGHSACNRILYTQVWLACWLLFFLTRVGSLKSAEVVKG